MTAIDIHKHTTAGREGGREGGMTMQHHYHTTCLFHQTMPDTHTGMPCKGQAREARTKISSSLLHNLLLFLHPPCVTTFTTGK